MQDTTLGALYIFLAVGGMFGILLFVFSLMYMEKRRQKLEKQLQLLLRSAAKTVTETKTPARLGMVCPCAECPLMRQALREAEERDK